MYIDILLKNHDADRKHFMRQTGFSHKKISKLNKQDPNSYSEELIKEIAQFLNLSYDNTRNELRQINEKGTLYKAHTVDELKIVIDTSPKEFLVGKEVYSLINDIKQSDISHDQQYMKDVSQTVLTSFILWIVGKVRSIGKSSEEKLINDIWLHILTYYDIHEMNNNRARLVLKAFVS
ncbi:hypothetical protein [Mammaliicoccus sciuri]|uniref:hypothetical protein n=1 Tax=Mammaliicoccus sciuri TaxID=1296 RepID=UPI002DC03E7E|nr:hypothetical protein [Mammaliicoccus sciuri]MEB7734355.1 helix-turn-helix domain-containing protein [Mammaliicoccus sciuri]